MVPNQAVIYAPTLSFEKSVLVYERSFYQPYC